VKANRQKVKIYAAKKNTFLKGFSRVKELTQ